MKIFVFLFIAWFLVCCNKNSDNSGPYTLDGKWKMTDQYIGNVPVGEWTVPREATYYEFTKEDSLIINVGSATMRSKIQRLSDSTFVERSTTLVSTYKIVRDKLTIRNPCDEGCEWRFVRVKF